MYAEALTLNDAPLVASIDLTGVSTDANHALEQLAAPAGLLIAAELTTSGEGDSGAVALRASEYYLPLSAKPPSGTATDAAAADGGSCSVAPGRDGGPEAGAWE